MRSQLIAALSALLLVVGLFSTPVRAATAPGHSGYTPTLTGGIYAYGLAGVEPDGDPIDRVVLNTRLSVSGGIPATHLIISAYLENFKPDTTPILPDLLNGKVTAQNLGGFLEGKALLTDDAGDVLFIGSFVAEAFLDNSNHAVITLFGPGASGHSVGSLKGIFLLVKNGNNVSLTGSLHGTLALSVAERRQIRDHQGVPMRSVGEIIKVVTVHPAPMVGRSTTPSKSTPLHTGYGSTKGSASSSSRHISPWSIVAGAGAILSLSLAAILYIWERRKNARPATERSVQ